MKWGACGRGVEGMADRRFWCALVAFGVELVVSKSVSVTLQKDREATTDRLCAVR
jgi:hypothetical protein